MTLIVYMHLASSSTFLLSATHETVKEAVIKDGWEITDDPYVISYGDRFLFVDLGASGFIGLQQGNKQIAIEIKQFRGQSQVNDLEQAIG